MKRNLVLAGFMGVGKSSVGRIVAERLGREFIDMDERLATDSGMSLIELMATRGQADLRAAESELLRELSGHEGRVISTGGGTLVSPGNRALVDGSIVICLDAALAEILHRIERQPKNDRPLLAGNGAANVNQLFADRAEAYRAIPLHIDTSGKSSEQVAREVVRQYLLSSGAMEELSVRTPEGLYPIWLGPGIARYAGTLLAGLTRSRRCAVVTNPTVALFHAAMLLTALRADGFDPVCITIPDGEAYKNLDTLSKLYDEFVEAGLERDSLVIALGGGVVGDIAGLAAATFMRGLPFVQIPTTLLSMVDASIGGKVAVDHAAGKNLIGAFKFPLAVLADPKLLDTLPEAEYRAGMAEVIKHGIIGDPELFSALESGPLDTALLARALRVKIALVEQDPFERNVRAHLNLGHTFGHAIETLTDYRVSHGYAVAIGMACAARLSVRLGYCDTATRERIISLLERYGLPTRIPSGLSHEAIVKTMRRDKKVSAGRLRLVLPKAIGEVRLVEDAAEEGIIASIKDEGRKTEDG